MRTEGGLLPAGLLTRVAALDPELGGMGPFDYDIQDAARIDERIAHAFSRLVGAWASHRGHAAPDGWPVSLLAELGYHPLRTSKALRIEERSYPVSHEWIADAVPIPIHLVGPEAGLDVRAADFRRSPHSLMQELLNRSPRRTWGFISNGRDLRLLRDNATLTRQAYVQFDLEAIMEARLYVDFRLLWLLCHASRMRGALPQDSWIERWALQCKLHGARALERLRDGVRDALLVLGRGFLQHKDNEGVRQRLRDGTLETHDFWRGLLRLVYRMIFLFVAEERTYDCQGRRRPLLLRPDAELEACSRYLSFYSMGRLRRLADARRASRHGDLFASLRRVMHSLGPDEGCRALGLPALGTALWSGDGVLDLALSNVDLLHAVRALSTATDGTSRWNVDFGSLGAEELGSVYESLLELHPSIDVEAGRFDLGSASGNERRTSGSYYTPASLIVTLLDAALEPALAEALRQPDPQRAILGLKVLDPACGSGHFLIAAAHRMAHRLARVRTGDDEPPPPAVRSALRDVISRCLHGVDLNDMAVELCKIALWMESVEPGLPLSFLDHRVVWGNSLLGAPPGALEQGIPDAAFQGDADSKRRNRLERARGTERLRLLDEWRRVEQCAMEIDAVLQDSIGHVRQVERLHERCRGMPEHALLKLVSDAWCAAFVNGDASVTDAALVGLAGGTEASAQVASHVSETAERLRFHHWPLVFPEVLQARGGFDVILGNPPYLRDSRKGDLPAVLLKHLYASAVSHYDLCILFIELGLRLLRPGGRMALLTSNGWLRQKYGQRIRALLADRALTHLLEVDYMAFDAGVKTCITAVMNAAPSGTVRVLQAKRASDLLNAEAVREIPSERLRSMATFSLETLLGDPIPAGDHARFVRLEEIAFVSLGIVFHDPRPGGKRKYDYLSSQRSGAFRCTLLDGEHVERWRVNGCLWLDYQPSEHREPRFDELFCAPQKILCRRIVGAAPIMAYLDETGAHFSDNVVGIVPYRFLTEARARAVRSRLTPEALALSEAFDLWFLVGLLNSAALTAHYRAVQGGDKHFYPAHAKALPIPRISLEQQRPISDLARRMQILPHGRAVDGQDCERELNALVSALYEAAPQTVACTRVISA